MGSCQLKEEFVEVYENEEHRREYNEDDFRIEKMKQEYFDELMILVKESFATREPLICGLHLGNEEALDYLSNAAKEWVTYQSSVCAVYIPENKIVGANFTKILSRDNQETFKEEDVSHYTRGVQKILKILTKIENSYNIFQHDETADKVLEIAVLTVDPNFSGNKLAYRMNEESERIGLEMGCQIATAQATNKISQHIFEKLGFENRLSIDYEDFELDGERPLDISAMNETKSVIIVVKYLK